MVDDWQVGVLSVMWVPMGHWVFQPFNTTLSTKAASCRVISSPLVWHLQLSLKFAMLLRTADHWKGFGSQVSYVDVLGSMCHSARAKSTGYFFRPPLRSTAFLTFIGLLNRVPPWNCELYDVSSLLWRRPENRVQHSNAKTVKSSVKLWEWWVVNGFWFDSVTFTLNF